MRVNVKVGTLPPGHVFVTPLTRRLGCVVPVVAPSEVLGIDVELCGPIERKALHPDVLVEVAVHPPLTPPSRGPLE